MEQLQTDFTSLCITKKKGLKRLRRSAPGDSELWFNKKKEEEKVQEEPVLKKRKKEGDAKAFDRKKHRVLALTSFSFHKKIVHKISNEWLEAQFGHLFRYLKVVIERCPETGKLHSHIAAQCLSKKQVRTTQVRKMFNDPTIEFAVCGNFPGWCDYCDPSYKSKNPNKPYFGKTKKEYTHVLGPFEFGMSTSSGDRNDLILLREKVWSSPSLPAFWRSEAGMHPSAVRNRAWINDMWACRPRPNLHENTTLRPIQVQLDALVRNVLKRNNSNVGKMGRQFIIVLDPEGGIGKTVLASYWIHHGIGIELEGKLNDLKHVYSKDPRSIVVMDLERVDANEQHPPIPYYLIEKFMKGQLTVGKYDNGLNTFAAPAPIVFTNRSLHDLAFNDLIHQTHDRWVIVEHLHGTLQIYGVTPGYSVYKLGKPFTDPTYKPVNSDLSWLLENTSFQ